MSNADDAVEGACCQQCGVYFEKAHGYPVVCYSCWEDATPEERTALGLIRATESAL